ncbi:hypothetical protein TELCIR_07793 [Teladorsagia circumcincta]|uniref:Immunoglobulin I-set domain-containing protein n=1 Tax=Teladorsagia circumcincta TaxID=45464 RepID=A0A2G9UJN4_TELCI|nr:hypothetical protein TELCIR_07793 [Teladorsagia circumcincta]
MQPEAVINPTPNLTTHELSDKIALEGIAVRITEADYPHAGLYTCEAINEYTASGKTSRPLIVMEKTLDVKSELAWIYPLAVIVIILVLLVIIIGLCELRKRRQNRQSRYITQE